MSNLLYYTDIIHYIKLPCTYSTKLPNINQIRSPQLFLARTYNQYFIYFLFLMKQVAHPYCPSTFKKVNERVKGRAFQRFPRCQTQLTGCLAQFPWP